MNKPFAIVTGASSGIGLKLAAICAQEGFDLLVAAVSSAVTQLPASRRSMPTITSDNGARIFRCTVAHCTAPSSPAHRVSRRLPPTARDYFVLKPKHSGFFDTTLDTLLEALRIRRVILTGMAGNICVLFTANDAYMREYKIFAPADCLVSNTAADNDHAPYQLKTVLKGNVAVSTRLTFQAHGRPHHARRR